MIEDKITIGIVDDSLLARTLLCSYITARSEFLLLLEGDDPQDFLLDIERLDRQADIYIVDYHMPGMNGGQLALELRRRFPRVLILGFTSSSSVHELNHMLSCGVDGIFSKEGKEIERMLELILQVARIDV